MTAPPQTVSSLVAELILAKDLTPREAELLDHLIAAMDEIDALTSEVKSVQMNLDTGLEP